MFKKMWILALFVICITTVPTCVSSANQQGSSSQGLTMCRQPNVTAKAEAVDKSINNFYTCLNNTENIDHMNTELEDAIANHTNLHSVVKKYCAKANELKNCIHIYNDGIAICSKNLQKALITNKVIDEAIDYSCYNDGERIISFISEKGLECIQLQSVIQQCEYQTIANQSEEIQIALLMDKTLSPAQNCGYADQWVNCILTSYKSCDHPAPGNILEALYNVLRKNSECDAALPKN